MVINLKRVAIDYDELAKGFWKASPLEQAELLARIGFELEYELRLKPEERKRRMAEVREHMSEGSVRFFRELIGG